MKRSGRYELKFIIDEKEYTEVLRWLSTTTSFTESYPCRFVNSIYLDDPEFTSVRDNLAGIADRYKTRVRWYNDKNNFHSNPSLEVKIRDGRLGFKKHFSISGLAEEIINIRFTDLAYYIRDALSSDDDAHVFNKHLTPSLYVNYCRHYLESPFHLRVTIDSAIKYYLPAPFDKPGESSPIIYPHRILELKFPLSQKTTVSKLLNDLHLVPKRHSKYLMGLSMHGQVTYI